MMKLGKIVDSFNALTALSQMEFEMKLSYPIAKILSKVTPELKIYNEQHDKLIEKYGSLNENGTFQVALGSKNYSKFLKEQKILQEMEVKLDFARDKEIRKISIDELGDIKIAPGILAALDWLIE